MEVCRICHKPGAHPPLGRVVPAGRGWGIQRWWDEHPLVESLASKGEAYKLLYALRHGWSAVTVTFVTGATLTMHLQEFWRRSVVRDRRPPLIIKSRKGASANAQASPHPRILDPRSHRS
jgi:hypothetical protein